MIIKSCGHCGKNLPEHFKLGNPCPHCHLKVVHERHQPDDSDASDELKNQFISKFIGITLLLFALVFFIILSLKQPRQPDPVQPTSPSINLPQHEGIK